MLDISCSTQTELHDSLYICFRSCTILAGKLSKASDFWVVINKNWQMLLQSELTQQQASFCTWCIPQAIVLIGHHILLQAKNCTVLKLIVFFFSETFDGKLSKYSAHDWQSHGYSCTLDSLLSWKLTLLLFASMNLVFLQTDISFEGMSGASNLLLTRYNVV